MSIIKTLARHLEEEDDPAAASSKPDNKPNSSSIFAPVAAIIGEENPQIADRLNGGGQGENNTVYETEEERNQRYIDDEELIRNHIDSIRGDEDYETAFEKWKKRDALEQKTRDELSSGYRISVVGQINGNGSETINIQTLAGYTADEARAAGWILAEDMSIRELYTKKVDEAFNAFQTDGQRKKGDFEFLKAPRKAGRHTPIKDAEGNYIRYNAQGQRDPDGEYYLHSRHEKRKTGAVQFVDKALGTNFSSWLDEELIETIGGVVDTYTLGAGTQIIGGDSFVEGSRDQMNNLTNDNWDEANAIAQGVTDVYMSGMTGGAWTGVMAARTMAQGVTNEALGREFDWEGAAIGLGASFAGSFIGNRAMIASRGLGVANTTAQGAIRGSVAAGASSAISQTAQGDELNWGTVGERALVGGAAGSLAGTEYGDHAAVAATIINTARGQYEAGEISRAQYEEAVARAQEDERIANEVSFANGRDAIVSAFGGRRPTRDSINSGGGGGVDLTNVTNAFG